MPTTKTPKKPQRPPRRPRAGTTPRKSASSPAHLAVLAVVGADVPDEATLQAQREALHRVPLPWTEYQLTALDLIFEGRKTQGETAQLCHIAPRTLRDWIAHPDFQAALAAKRKALIESLDHVPYIRKERRLIALAQMAEDARQAYEEKRFLVERRQIGRDPETGDPLELTNEAYNRDAFESFRGALDDIAKELGARKQVQELGGTVNVRQTVQFYMPQPEAAPVDVLTVDADVAAIDAPQPVSAPFGLTVESAPDE